MLDAAFKWAASLIAAVTLMPTSEVEAQDKDPLPRKPSFGAALGADPNGVKITQLVPGQSADGHLQVGDVLKQLAGTPTDSVPAFMQKWNTIRSDEKIKTVVLRDGKEVEIEFVTKERPREVGDTYEVIYDHVVSNGKRIRTIVTRPQRSGQHPVFMLIQGLGEFSIDYPLSGSGPYSQFVSHFAKDGFVTIRVEKPGMGDAEGGPYPETDFDTEADVYLQALRAVKKYPFVDPNRVFIYGHSMGGLFGPKIVAEEPVAGLIAASTVFKTWNEYWIENVRRQQVLGGASYPQVDQNARDIALMHTWVLTEGKAPDELAKVFPRLKPALDGTFPEGKTMQGRTIDFWRQLAQHNYADWWAKVDSPTLAVWGQYDFVSTEEDHHMIVSLLNNKKPGLATYKRIDNADHGFSVVSSYEDAFARFSQPKPFNAEVINVIDTWIRDQIAKSESEK